MVVQIFGLSLMLLICEGAIPDRFLYRSEPLGPAVNQGIRLPGPNWAYQVVNGKPVISGYPNSHSYVAFGLNPQTGQIDQTQIITQTRPGGPFINLVQRGLQVFGQFLGQLSATFANTIRGALLAGQDMQSFLNPGTSVIGISYPPVEKEPIQQPPKQVVEEIVKTSERPPLQISTISSLPTTPVPIEVLPSQATTNF